MKRRTRRRKYVLRRNKRLNTKRIATKKSTVGGWWFNKEKEFIKPHLQPLDKLDYGILKDTTIYAPQYLPNLNVDHPSYEVLQEIKHDFGIELKNCVHKDITLKLVYSNYERIDGKYREVYYRQKFTAQLLNKEPTDEENPAFAFFQNSHVWCEATFKKDEPWRVVSEITESTLYEGIFSRVNYRADRVLQNIITYEYNEVPVFKVVCSRIRQKIKRRYKNNYPDTLYYILIEINKLPNYDKVLLQLQHKSIGEESNYDTPAIVN
jgi:hypothetical protein